MGRVLRNSTALGPETNVSSAIRSWTGTPLASKVQSTDSVMTGEG
ncbi:hypothetical protein GZL_00344 [Streptomyces sp. 769]|nr:hypothetical protein GZL_00344 [Streptomyces sp. 769]